MNYLPGGASVSIYLLQLKYEKYYSNLKQKGSSRLMVHEALLGTEQQHSALLIETIVFIIRQLSFQEFCMYHAYIILLHCAH